MSFFLLFRLLSWGGAIFAGALTLNYVISIFEQNGAYGVETQHLQAALTEAVSQGRQQREQILDLNQRQNETNQELHDTRLEAEQHKQALEALPEAGTGVTCDIDSLFPQY